MAVWLCTITHNLYQNVAKFKVLSSNNINSRKVMWPKAAFGTWGSGGLINEVMKYTLALFGTYWTWSL